MGFLKQLVIGGPDIAAKSLAPLRSHLTLIPMMAWWGWNVALAIPNQWNDLQQLDSGFQSLPSDLSENIASWNMVHSVWDMTSPVVIWVSWKNMASWEIQIQTHQMESLMDKWIETIEFQGDFPIDFPHLMTPEGMQLGEQHDDLP